MVNAQTPAVSVVVSCYNYGRFIGATLDSVLAQTLEAWECIVVDDGSTDDSRQVIERYATRDNRIRFIFQQNQGPSAARNAGMRAAAGEYIMLLDADDLIEPGKLELQFAYLKSHPEVDLVYGNVRFFPTDNPAQRSQSMWSDTPWMPLVSGQGEDLLKVLTEVNIMVINAALFRKSICDDAGLMDPRTDGAEDWYFWWCAAFAGKRFVYDDEPGTLALVRVHPQSLSQDKRMLHRAMLLTRQYIAEKQLSPAIRALNRQMMGNLEVLLGIEESRRGGFWKGRMHFLRAALVAGKIKWLGYALLYPLVGRGGR